MVRAADGATRLVTDLLGASPTAGRERITEAELRDLVAANTLLDPDERRIIDEVLVAGASLVREVMMPRTEVVFLAARLTVAEAERLVRAETHTRVPGGRRHPRRRGRLRAPARRAAPPRPRPGATVGELTREVSGCPAASGCSPR